MIYLLAFLLGLVQGVAEFLPISSSGHLALAEELLANAFGESNKTLQGSEFSIAVHVGTLGSILIVYWRRLLAAATNVRLIALVVLATLPVVLTGLLLKDQFESLMTQPRAVGVALIVTAALLACISPLERWHAGRRAAVLPDPLDAPAAEAIAAPIDEAAYEASDEAADEAADGAVSGSDDSLPTGRTMETMTWRDALVVGLVQSIAPVPGISRSGSTIFAGVLSGMDRRAAADFSFFIAVPAIAGAAVLKIKDVVEAGTSQVAPDVLCWGAVVALVTGLAALKVLLAIVARGRLMWFSIYCAVVGLAAIVLA